MRKPRLRKRMYAVSGDGKGIVSGTLAYSRKRAIEHFLQGLPLTEWEQYKRYGHRTVVACVKIIPR
jgi:hypothetical protein